MTDLAKRTWVEAAELFHHEVMTKGFVRAKGWDLAGGRIEPEFDDPDLVQFSFDKLAIHDKPGALERLMAH